MSRAEELARQSENLAEDRLDSDDLYEWSVDADVQLRMNAAELRRLSAVEAELEALKKAIGDAEPVAWDVYVAEEDNGYLVDSLDDPQLIDDCTNHDASVTPLYTLKGIKK